MLFLSFQLKMELPWISFLLQFIYKMVFFPFPSNIKQVVLIKDSTCHACLSNWEIHLLVETPQMSSESQELALTGKVYESCFTLEVFKPTGIKFHRHWHHMPLDYLSPARTKTLRLMFPSHITINENKPLIRYHHRSDYESAMCVNWYKFKCKLTNKCSLW